jgi:hypothetical protein
MVELEVSFHSTVFLSVALTMPYYSMVSSKLTVFRPCVRITLNNPLSRCVQSNYVSLFSNLMEYLTNWSCFFQNNVQGTCRSPALSCHEVISICFTVPGILIHNCFVFVMRKPLPLQSVSATEDLYFFDLRVTLFFRSAFYVPYQLAISHSFISVTGRFLGLLCQAFLLVCLYNRAPPRCFLLYFCPLCFLSLRTSFFCGSSSSVFTVCLLYGCIPLNVYLYSIASGTFTCSVINVIDHIMWRWHFLMMSPRFLIPRDCLQWLWIGIRLCSVRPRMQE